MTTKPSRPPDYISPLGGSYFWFDEMIYSLPDGEPRKMMVDSGDNRLMRAGTNRPEKSYFRAHVNEARDKWWREIFESKFTSNE